MFCSRFVHRFGPNGETQDVYPEYIKSGDYEIEIAGIRYPAKVRLQPPVLPSLSQGAANKNTKGGGPGYQATRH